MFQSSIALAVVVFPYHRPSEPLSSTCGHEMLKIGRSPSRVNAKREILVGTDSPHKLVGVGYVRI